VWNQEKRATLSYNNPPAVYLVHRIFEL
jgi:hypothetical protein